MPISQSPGRSETGKYKDPFINNKAALNRLFENLFHPLRHNIYLFGPE